MKLIDLLVKEVDVWPTGVNYIVQNINDVQGPRVLGFIDKPYKSEDDNWVTRNGLNFIKKVSEFSQDCDSAVVTQAMWQNALIEEEADKQWGGREDGLPPIGTTVEFSCSERIKACDWTLGKVMYMSANTAVIYTGANKEFVAHPNTLNFRPIDPEAREREEAIRHMVYKIQDADTSNIRAIAECLHGYGYRLDRKED